MHVFVTGASGHIGQALVPELLSSGHRVTGLARSEKSAEALRKAGANVVRGDLDDLEALQAAARAAEGVVHLAFKHDIAFSGHYAEAAAADLRVIEAIGAALAGSNKPFVGTAGTLALAYAVKGRAGTEDDVLPGGPRIDNENAVVALAKRGVRSSVIRLAPTVHSDLDTSGFVPTLIQLARQNGAAAYLGEGQSRWPALHTLDAAVLYRRALESAPAGSRLHGAAEDVTFRQRAEAIARRLGVPAISVTVDEAPKHFGYLSAFAQLDNPISSAKTRELLQWQPTRPGLLADLELPHYFAAR